MLAKGKEWKEGDDEIKAVEGELSKFTYAPDLAAESKALVEENADHGIYHIVNDGAVSWYEGVKELYDIANIKVDVTPVPPDTWPRPAKRPPVSVLAVTKREPLRHYKEALSEYLAETQK